MDVPVKRNKDDFRSLSSVGERKASYNSRCLLKVTTVRSMAKSIITDANLDPVLLKLSEPAFNSYVQKALVCVIHFFGLLVSMFSQK